MPLRETLVGNRYCLLCSLPHPHAERRQYILRDNQIWTYPAHRYDSGERRKGLRRKSDQTYTVAAADMDPDPE